MKTASRGGSGRRIRSWALQAIHATGLPLLALRQKRDQGTIILYHGVTREQGDGIFNYRNKFVRTDSFAQHIEWLKRRFTILPLQTLIETLGTEYPKPPLAITFDDGYANNYTDAFPILRTANVPATFFVTSGFIEGTPLAVDRLEYALGGNAASITLDLPSGTFTFPLMTRTERLAADAVIRPQLKRLPTAQQEDLFATLIAATRRDLVPLLPDSPYAPMKWREMQEMQQHGMTFAAHTVTHPILAKLSIDDARTEITASHEALAAHDLSPLNIFAYPNGGAHDFNDETVQVLRETGFTASLTTKSGDCTPETDRLRLPRYTLDGANEPYRLSTIVSGLQRKLQGV